MSKHKTPATIHEDQPTCPACPHTGWVWVETTWSLKGESRTELRCGGCDHQWWTWD